MPSQRRLRTFFILILVLVLVTLYMTSSARQTQSSEFYKKTSAALEEKAQAALRKEAAADAKLDRTPADDAKMKDRLKEAEERAKISADRKGEVVKEDIKNSAEKEEAEKGEKSVAGRRIMKEDGQGGVAQAGSGREQKVMTQEEHKAEIELGTILKKSPIIVFSKTYCPYSRKAKHILLEQYKIDPPPYVVELDEHPQGAQLQETLAEMTGRRTVPNILINGKSIGGGDDIEQLHESGKLMDTVKSMGGKRIMEARLVSGKTRRAMR